MKAERLSLNDPAVQAAKKDFYRPKQGLRPTATFEEYFKFFSDEANTFTDIGNRLSISREAVRQIYQKYFSSLFPDRPSGQARNSLYARKRREEAEKRLCLPARLRELADTLRQQNYHCEGIPLFHPDGTIRAFRKDALLINTKQCQVRYIHCAATTHSGNWRSYTPVHIRIRSIRHYDFLVVIQNVKGYPNRFFILPVTEILKLSPARRTRTLYIPLQKLPPYHNRQAKVDFWRYENAWYLLKETLRWRIKKSAFCS